MQEAPTRRPGSRLLALPVLLAILVGAAILLLVGNPGQNPTGDATPTRDEAGAADPRLAGSTDATEPEAGGPAPPTATPAVIGRVLDAGGRAVVGAEVALLVGGQWTAGETVGEDGGFSLPLPDTVSFTVLAQAPGYQPATIEKPLPSGTGDTLDLGIIRLAPGLRVAGRVVTKSGHPVDGAELSIEPEAVPVSRTWHLLSRKQEDFAEREANADGRFAFSGLPPGRYRVRLYTERAWYGDQVREHLEAGTDDVDFVVPDSERLFDVALKIRVVGPDDLPVPRVQVRLWGGAMIGMTVDGGKDTEIGIEEASDPVRLLVWDARNHDGNPLGYAPALLEGVRSQAGTLVVRMEPGLEVTGRVSWEGEPRRWVLQASTFRGKDGRWSHRWEDGEDPAVSVQARTDLEGHFRFRGLPAGSAGIGLFSHEGPGRLKGHGAVVEVPSTGVLLEMVQTGTVRIVLRAPTGKLLRSTNARVEQWVEGGVREVFSTQISVGSRSRGKPEFDYTADGLELGGRFRIVVAGTCDGRYCGPIVVDDVRIRDEPYVVVLEPGSRIAGRVVYPDGAPAVDVQVHTRLPPGGGFIPYEWNPAGLSARWAKTGANGEFAIDAPVGAAYLLPVYAPGWTALLDPTLVKAGTTDARIVLHPAHPITGRVHDADGRPADGFEATGIPAEGVPVLWSPNRIAADGFFEAPVGPGRWRVSVWNDRDEEDLRYALSDGLAAGAKDVRLVLAEGAALAGRLLTASGASASGARVWVLGPHVNRRAHADDEGRFLVHGIPPGRHEVFVRMPDGEEQTVPAAVTEVGTPTELDLVLR